MPDSVLSSGWSAADVPMLLAVPVLLLLSGFVSGAETALFGLSDAQRLVFRHGRALSGRAIEVLLADRGMLLITILLTNTTVNVLYFVITTVLIIRSGVGPLGETLLAIGFLLLIVFVGEIGPKVLATVVRMRYAAFASPLLVTVHGLITPVRLMIRHSVIAPLSRLTSPGIAPPALSDEELKAFLEVSHEEGVLGHQEQRMLRRVLEMRELRVRDVMTPRLDLQAIPADATREDVGGLVRAHARAKLPVYERDVDHVIGILQVKRFLFDRTVERVDDPRVMVPANFVPELATLDQLLDHFQSTHTQSALVVDEYGGTEGIVAVEDVVEELVGEIARVDEAIVPPPRLVGLGCFEADGAMSVRAFAKMFELDLGASSVSTLGGLITDRLGRSPSPGDGVDLGPVHAKVLTVERNRVRLVRVTLRDLSEGSESPDADPEARS